MLKIEVSFFYLARKIFFHHSRNGVSDLEKQFLRVFFALEQKTMFGNYSSSRFNADSRKGKLVVTKKALTYKKHQSI
jgi:hypothetical protein